MDSVDVLLAPFLREYSYGYNYDYFLENTISRIVTRYGAFRNLEASFFLDKKERTNDEGDLNNDQGSNVSDVLIDLKYDVQQVREKLINMISNAQNECSLILDFVSLLVSSVNPTLGNSSMSTFLRERIPPGSFGIERTKEEVPEEDLIVSKGWKLQALSKATSDLLDASIRIDKETILEAKFWEQVNVLRQHGWNLMHSRIGHLKSFTVNYGIDVPRVFGKGFAVLKRSIDGDVKFDGIDMSETFKITRLRFVENNITKGEVIWDNSSFFRSFDKNTQFLSRSRDSFFEEELLEEIINEVNFFDDLNAVIIDNGVSVEVLGSNRVLLFDIVDSSTKIKELNGEYDILCEAILSMLHLFFSYYESQKLKWSDNLPFLSKTQDKKQSRVLLPVISQLSHYFILNEISKELDNCTNIILSEGWFVNYRIKKYVDMDFGTSEDSIIQTIVNGARSIIEIYLSGSSQVIMNIQTLNYKTIFEIDFHDSGINGFVSRKTVCGSILETLECLIWSINKDFVNVLQVMGAPNWKIKNGELVNINNTKRLKIDISAHRSEDGTWNVFLYKNGMLVDKQDSKVSDIINKML